MNCSGSCNKNSIYNDKEDGYFEDDYGDDDNDNNI